MTEQVDRFREIWKSADRDEKNQIFQIMWDEIEPACLNAKKLPPCPYEKIRQLYHEILPSNPKIVELTNTRKGHIKARWRRWPSIKYWEQYFTMVSREPFLIGQGEGTSGRKPFVADIDFLIKEQTWIKVMEGFYKRQRGG